VRSLLIAVSGSVLAYAQVAPTAIPIGTNPPVVFLNGYQATCPGNFAGTFGNAASVFAASGISTVFFDNCTVAAASGKPDIEAMAAAFGAFLGGLRYTDGTAVPRADVVAYDMGGLIVRAWLAGKQDVTPAQFVPPGNTLLRRGVFLAVPNFGTTYASVLGNDVQTQEMSPGSQFLVDINTWNGGYDDLAGFNAIAIAGNVGTGQRTGITAFDDGVVTLNSASIGFALTGSTRVLPACHAANLGGLCSPNNPAIANIDSAANLTGQIITSFLTGTAAWQSLGAAVEGVPQAANTGGILLDLQDANGGHVTGSASSIVGQNYLGNLLSGAAAQYRESLPARTNLFVQTQVTGGYFDITVNLPNATSAAVITKPGPLIHGVVPAGSAVFPYNVTSGAYVAIYGANFTGGASTAPLPYPATLGGVTVTVNGQPAALQYVGPSQINMIFPTLPAGPVTLSVANAVGTSTTTSVVAPAVPSVFSLDGSGTGAAAAINGSTGVIVSPTAPLKAGVDSVELFLTGLGPVTTGSDGLAHANAAVTASVGGLSCPVTYAGRVPGVPGLDQVNCQIPAALTSPSAVAVPAVVTAAGRASNTVVLIVK
jgi:uncharacterized protein (TIGR03437 family)